MNRMDRECRKLRHSLAASDSTANWGLSYYLDFAVPLARQTAFID